MDEDGCKFTRPCLVCSCRARFSAELIWRLCGKTIPGWTSKRASPFSRAFPEFLSELAHRDYCNYIRPSSMGKSSFFLKSFVSGSQISFFAYLGCTGNIVWSNLPMSGPLRLDRTTRSSLRVRQLIIVLDGIQIGRPIFRTLSYRLFVATRCP